MSAILSVPTLTHDSFLLQGMGPQFTAGIVQQLGVQPTAALVQRFGPQLTGDLVQAFGAQLTGELVRCMGPDLTGEQLLQDMYIGIAGVGRAVLQTMYPAGNV